MSKQGRQPDHQSERRDVNREDYQSDEETLLLALAKLRLLNNPVHSLSLREAISRARQLAEPHKLWEQSAAPIKGINVRLSSGERVTPDKDRNECQYRIRLNADPPPRTALEIWAEVDDGQFDEVLLAWLSLSNMPPDGLRFKKVYPNGQTLCLRVKRRPSKDFFISVELTRPDVRREALASIISDTLLFWKGLRRPWVPSLAMAVLLTITSGATWHIFTLRHGTWRTDVAQELMPNPTPPVGISIPTVTLRPYEGLRSAGHVVINTEGLDVSAPYIRFVLKLPPEEIGESYKAALTDEFDRTLFTVRSLRRDNDYVSVILSKQLLPRGSYRLALAREDETRIDIYYTFNISK